MKNSNYSQYQPLSSQQDPSFSHQLQQQPSATSYPLQETLQLHQNSEQFGQSSSLQQGITPQQSSLQSYGQNSCTPVTQQMIFSTFQQHSSSSDATQSLHSLSDDLLTELESGTEDLDLFATQSSSWSTPQNNIPQKRMIPPPPPFSTPPKLFPVEQVMNDHPGTDVNSLRELAKALARDAIFGRDKLIKSSLSGRKNTGNLDKKKMDYIKTVVHSRRPSMSDIDFENIWALCRSSISKSCQTLRTNARRKL